MLVVALVVALVITVIMGSTSSSSIIHGSGATATVGQQRLPIDEGSTMAAAVLALQRAHERRQLAVALPPRGRKVIDRVAPADRQEHGQQQQQAQQMVAAHEHHRIAVVQRGR